MADNICEYIQEVAPPRLLQNDFSKDLLTALFGISADVNQIAKGEAVSGQNCDITTSFGADEIALEDRGEFVYNNSTRDSNLELLKSTWDLWQGSVGHSAIELRLRDAGYSGSLVISNGLLGSGTFPIHNVANEWDYNETNGNALNYPSSDEYPFQFIVVVNVTKTSDVGTTVYKSEWDWPQTGNDPVSEDDIQVKWDVDFVWDEVYSTIIANADLVEIINIIRRFKPVDWICREIVIIPKDSVLQSQWESGVFADDPQQILYETEIERWNPN